MSIGNVYSGALLYVMHRTDERDKLKAQVEELQEEKESLIEQRAVMRLRIKSLVKMLPRGRREP